MKRGPVISRYAKGVFMEAKEGMRVRVRYVLKTDAGEAVDSYLAGIPTEFTIGQGDAVPGFEEGILDMKEGERRTIRVPVEEAYGKREERKVFELPRERMPKDFDPRIGQTVQIHRPDGSTFTATVVEYTEKGFRMDANHPLAGKNLIFDVELLKVFS